MLRSVRIDFLSVHQRVITSALRYTPVVLDHHVPCNVLPTGKLWVRFVTSRPHVHGLVLPSKPPAQTPKFKTLQKLILSFFHNVMHLLSQLTDSGMIVLSVAESVKLVPYIASSRKTLKLYTKVRVAPLAACSCRDRFRM